MFPCTVPLATNPAFSKSANIKGEDKELSQKMLYPFPSRGFASDMTTWCESPHHIISALNLAGVKFPVPHIAVR